MQKLKVEKPMAKTQNAELSPSSQPCNSTETFKKAWNKQKKDWCNQGKVNSANRLQATWVTSCLTGTKKIITPMPVATFGRNFKKLVLVGNHHLLKPLFDHWSLLWRLKNKDDGWEHLDILRDCVPCTYYLMFFWKIKKRFELWSNKSKVSTLTPVDASGLTIWLSNTGTHKIDDFTLKNKDGWRECLDVPQELQFFGNESITMTLLYIYQRKSLLVSINQYWNSQD